MVEKVSLRPRHGRTTVAEWQTELECLFDGRCKVVDARLESSSEFIRVMEPYLHTCPECGQPRLISPKEIREGVRKTCRPCADRKKIGAPRSAEAKANMRAAQDRQPDRTNVHEWQKYLDTLFGGRCIFKIDQVEYDRDSLLKMSNRYLHTCPTCGRDWNVALHKIRSGKSKQCVSCRHAEKKGKKRAPEIAEKVQSALKKPYEEILKQCNEGKAVLEPTIFTYNWYKENYRNSNTKLPFMCRRCGRTYWAVIWSALTCEGCNECRGESLSLSTRKSFQDVLQICSDAGLVLDFSVFTSEWFAKHFRNMHTLLPFVCQRRHETGGCGKTYWSTKYNAIKNQGCSDCAPYGFNDFKPAVNYCGTIRLTDGHVAFVHGITAGTSISAVKRRYGTEFALLCDLAVFSQTDGRTARFAEAEMIATMKEHHLNDKRLSPFKSKTGTRGEILVGDMSYLRRTMCRIIESHGGILAHDEHS